MEGKSSEYQKQTTKRFTTLYRIKQENDNNGIGIQKLILDLTGRESINQINI